MKRAGLIGNRLQRHPGTRLCPGDVQFLFAEKIVSHADLLQFLFATKICLFATGASSKARVSSAEDAPGAGQRLQPSICRGARAAITRAATNAVLIESVFKRLAKTSVAAT